MADLICRALRDGGSEGEHAPALTIKDTINCPLGTFLFDHIFSQLFSFILHKKSQSQAIVLVSLSRSTIYYKELLKKHGYDVASSSTWVAVLDCYSDPLGWKRKRAKDESFVNFTSGHSNSINLCENVKSLDGLCSLIVERGKEMVGDGKGKFVVAIDSVSEMIRLTSLTSVAVLLSNLRCHVNVSCLFWLLHSDLHVTETNAALEYISTVQASIEPMLPLMDEPRKVSGNLTWMEENLIKGKLNVRFKRRNGRVRTVFEVLHVETPGLKFSPLSSENEIISQSIVPKVQFNLQLTEKERDDRAKVVLPFEHQGNGKSIQVYDGRKSLYADKAELLHNPFEKAQTMDSTGGEIVYFRDSDDEMPDSDEDPDDDLDI